jgi:hypothetical protein
MINSKIGTSFLPQRDPGGRVLLRAAALPMVLPIIQIRHNADDPSY